MMESQREALGDRPEFILRKDLQRISRTEEGASWKLLELHMDGDTPDVLDESPR